MPVQLAPIRRRIARTIAVYGIETTAILCAALLAFLLRFDFSIPAFYVKILLLASAVWVPTKLISFKALGLDRRWARYVSLSDLVLLSFSNALGSVAALFVLLASHIGVPKSVYAIDLLLSSA